MISTLPLALLVFHWLLSPTLLSPTPKHPPPQVTVYAPLFNEENGEATDETFNGLQPLSIPEFATALNLNYDVAQKCYNEAITDHMLITTFHDQEFVFAFNEHNFPCLDPLISFLSDYTRTSFFSHINCLLEDLKAGIHAALQHELIRLLICEDLFWPGVAKHLGFTSPDLDIAELGNKPSFMIHSGDRAIAHKFLHGLAKTFKTNVQDFLLERSRNDSNSSLALTTSHSLNGLTLPMIKANGSLRLSRNGLRTSNPNSPKTLKRPTKGK